MRSCQPLLLRPSSQWALVLACFPTHFEGGGNINVILLTVFTMAIHHVRHSPDIYVMKMYQTSSEYRKDTPETVHHP